MVNVDRNPESKYSGIQLFADSAKNGICAMSYNSTVIRCPSALRRHTETGGPWSLKSKFVYGYYPSELYFYLIHSC